ncbi:hypothetical protein BASA50_010516 [Batrachochytrium salamandrivorans]|uniref:Uncharacterized protein n=1 Tax=Batrachochytrium salamandrivorans TaxID=1357716 RepID=A0ABQ8EY93_9FUNG|nr:hypothetical protein BASA50_010516 [Batrachochytrium salamandrivorans]
MQFFYLVSLVVVASNVAAFPQPAELSEKHSESVNADLTSNIEARSYQPEFNPQAIRQKIKNAIDNAETGSLMLSSIINQVEHSRAVASENPGTDENATGGSTKETIVEYIKNALYISTSMKTWVKENREWMLIVIKSGLNSVEYSKAKSALKKAGERLVVDVSMHMKAANDALLAIEKNASPIKLKMGTIHASYTQALDAYRMYLSALQLQLDKFEDDTSPPTRPAHTNPDSVQCNTLRDEWSRLKATATQLERVDDRKQWAKHADNLDRAVSDGRTDLVFSAARAMSGNSSHSAAVTPLYNSDGIVQYDPTSIMRVMQGHYGSLAADTTGHSLDLQYWHDRQPIQVSRDIPTIRNSDILDQDFS